MVDVRIDEPGAGAWIMERAHGAFRDGWDHAFSTHDNTQILGGIALVDYLGASMAVHMAGDDPRWFNRELAWVAFDYAFGQLGCLKLLAPVRSDNYTALAVNLRGGWTLTAIIRDAYAEGVHMMVLEMSKNACPWLAYTPRQWRRREAA